MFSLATSSVKAAPQPTPAQIQRSEEITDQETSLRNKLNRESKVYIKQIMIKGASLISADKMSQIILSFQKHWLSSNDIQLIIDLIKQAYQQSGFKDKPVKIEHRLKNHSLNIYVQEAAGKPIKKEEEKKR